MKRTDMHLWKIFDYPCGQRLRPVLQTEVQRLRKMGVLKISDKIAEKLNSISSATIDRLLRPIKQRWRYERKGSHNRRKSI